MGRRQEDTYHYECRLAALARVHEAALDLGEVAALIGLVEDPVTTPEAVVGALDEFADRLRPRLRPGLSPLDRLQLLVRFLFEEEGFAGNERAYYEVANSHLHQVLDRRLGIPITLAVVMIEVGRRLEIPLAGVGFPTHFLVVSRSLPEIFIDPFYGGHLLCRGECEALLARVAGGALAGERRFLAPADPRYIAIRMLNNLKGIHLREGSLGPAIAVLDRLLAFAPDAVESLRDRGLLYLELGETRRAAADLAAYLERAPAANDRQVIREHLAVAERRRHIVH